MVTSNGKTPIKDSTSLKIHNYCRLHKLWAATLPVGADVDAAAAFLLTWRRGLMGVRVVSAVLYSCRREKNDVITDVIDPN